MKKFNLGLIILLLFLCGVNEMSAQKAKAWVAPKSSDTTVNPIKGNVKATAGGQKIFNQMCYICHGLQGKGDGAGGLSLNPKPANFLTSAIKAETDGNLFWKITEGKGGMASYKDVYSERQRWELVNYIRKLQQ